jgi:hypothetical protein
MRYNTFFRANICTVKLVFDGPKEVQLVFMGRKTHISF